MTDDEFAGFLQSFQTIARLAAQTAPEGTELLRDRLAGHLGQEPDLPVLAEHVQKARFADLDRALRAVAERDPDYRTCGVGGNETRYFQQLSDYAARSATPFPVAPVDYVTVATGPAEYRRCIALGVLLFRYLDHPVVVLLRQANARFGEQFALIEVMCADDSAASALLREVRELANETSLLRGQVLMLSDSEDGSGGPGVTFVDRPSVLPEDVILPPGTLERITTHIAGIAENAELLRAHGQHLKRGVLLYGPPGTGKTHTVRHAVSLCREHTVIILAGTSLRYITQAARIARNLQPALVVLEDCDLIAEDRSIHDGAKPLLFEVLDAMDGFDPDSDVTFLLTTNRVDALERALAQRPGRIDLAVEIPLPGLEARHRLLELYRGDVAYSAAALDDAAARTEGVTASFIKELMRRTVLNAAMAGSEPDDDRLIASLQEMQAQSDRLSAALLGGAQEG